SVYAVGATEIDISFNELDGDIVLLSTTYSLISDNTIMSAEIRLPYVANHNIIEDNTLLNGMIDTSNVGMGGSGSMNNTIQRNTIKIGGFTLKYWAIGIYISGGSSLNIISENVINVISNISSKHFDEFLGEAIVIDENSNNNSVIGNSISSSENGILVSDSLNNNITGNNISVYQNCIRGNSVDYNTIESNECEIINRESVNKPFSSIPFSIPFGHSFMLFIIVGVAVVFVLKLKGKYTVKLE
ncbi:MAG: hypothetical protein ACTSXP_08720, partial [Promethearchaeota archaeon]